ncbi:MAG: hypothetical protein GQ580_07595 [Candidatus Thorarchaeota archaeon]|nr:hypothetical protein [Candidatus Thorarchaeota archaeon]
MSEGTGKIETLTREFASSSPDIRTLQMFDPSEFQSVCLGESVSGD